MVWLCDQESTETFLKVAPPENRRLRRWWTSLAQLKLNIYRVPGLENGLCDWLSRENFDEKISASPEALSREAFQKMDVHLDLTMSKAELLSSLRKSDYVEEYGDVLKALDNGSYALVDKELWPLSSSGILRKEVQTCIPKKALGAALQWTHDVVGHPGPDSWLWAFEKMFHTRVPDTELTQKIEDMHRTCQECVTSKRNRPRDRGLLGVLPLPHMVNALLYVDFIDKPKCPNYDYALMIVDALSAFCQVVPCKKTIDGEDVLKLIKHHWIRFYGPPVRIHSDKDVRFKGDYGWYRNVFAAFSQPYRPQSNGLCERMNDEYQEELRILGQSIKTSNWVPLKDYLVICMNHKQRGKSGYSRGDVLHGRATLRLDLSFPHKGNVQVQDWVKAQNKIAEVVQAHLWKGRASRLERVNKTRKPAVVKVSDYVPVSRKRFKQLEVPKGAAKDVMRYGPYLITGVSSGCITARCSPTLGGEGPVALEFVKRFPFELVDDYGDDTIEEGDIDMLNDDERAALADEQDIVANEQDIPFYNQTEMERMGAYHVEQILRGQYRQGWRFLTKWEGYGTSESTWEPVRAFVHDDGKLNHVFVDYCLAHAPRFDTALRQARRMSSTLKKKASAKEPNEETVTDNKEPGEVSTKKVSQQRRGKRRRTEEPTVGGMAEDWLP